MKLHCSNLTAPPSVVKLIRIFIMVNDEMGKNTAIKQQTNQNKLIGMKEFLQSLFEEA